MDKPTKIHTLAGDFGKAELQEYCNSQFLALQKANHKISELQQEVDHLKALLSTTTPLVQGSEEQPFIIPSEQEIIEMQIKLIKERAIRGMPKQQELTLDDTKKLEVLVKTLKIIKEQPKDKGKSSAQEIPDSLLEAMASQKTE